MQFNERVTACGDWAGDRERGLLTMTFSRSNLVVWINDSLDFVMLIVTLVNLYMGRTVLARVHCIGWQGCYLQHLVFIHLTRPVCHFGLHPV